MCVCIYIYIYIVKGNPEKPPPSDANTIMLGKLRLG